jgi:Cu/Zn superoxide dismutase
MMKTRSCAVLLGLLALPFAACNSDSKDSGGGAAKMIGSSTGAAWMVFPDPYAGTAKAGMQNPITSTISGSATAWDVGGGKMRLQLQVSGLPPDRMFGSHLHRLSCTESKAGGHYQQNAAPGDAGSNPAFANATNEAWLDFKSDASGKASPAPETTVDWIPRAGEAKSIIIHDMGTAPGGIAGSKLACLPITFQ